MKKIIAALSLVCLSAVLHAVGIEARSRTVFYRGEENAVITAGISGVSSGELTVTPPAGADRVLPIRDGRVEIPVDTRLIPGRYQLRWRSGKDSGILDFTIGPEYFNGFPVCIWGDGFASHRLYQSHGFTHAIRHRSTRYLLGTETKFYDSDRKELDESLADGFIQGDTFDIGNARWGFSAELKKKYPRISRFGSRLHGNINVLDPEARHALENAALYLAKHPGAHPAYGIAVINSEVRDSTMPSFSRYDREAYRRYSGTDIPPLVNDKYAPYYTEIPGFPVSRIVPDDHPLLKYYVWFWKRGDGWNAMNSRIAQIFRLKLKHPFISVFDPAVRCPPVWGNGGDVDVLEHWTYANPDPIRVVTTIDELRAMAAEKKQKVYGMGQLFVYREQVAPLAGEKEYPADRFSAIRNERYITVPPDMLQEMVWAMLFRQIHGMMFHGGNSIFRLPGKSKYALSLPGTETRFADLMIRRIKPLAPLAAALPDRPPQIAVFQSVASAVFAGRGSQGNESWPYVLYRILQYGGYDPQMIFEEQLLRDGWGEIKVLLLPHCDVLTASALKKLQDFQQAGGILVADEFLMPELMPDLRLSSRDLMDGKSDWELTAAEKNIVPASGSREELSRKLALQSAGRRLTGKLEKFVRPLSSSDDPDLITSSRSGGSGDYLFAVNDKRGSGDYLGIYGRVLDKGLPNSGKIWLHRTSAAVYDCLTGEEVPVPLSEGKTVIPVRFATNDGKVFLLLDEKLGKLEISAPSAAAPGKDFAFRIRVLSVSGKPCRTIIPFRLSVSYADGKKADIQEYAVTNESGTYHGTFAVPLNAPAGNLVISAETLPGRCSGSTGIMIP